MAVLLTGGAGYIGSHTALALLEHGEEIIVADDLSNSSEESLRRVQELTGKSLRFYKLDVADSKALNALFEAEQIESVIHFAGLKAVGESVAQPLRYYRVNLGCTLTLLECMIRHGVKNLVFSSSATVYGEGTPPFRETDPTPGCTNPYGWTKLMIEQIIRDTAAANALSAAILRYFNPVGAHPSGRIGEDPQGIPNNLMPSIAQVAAGRRDHLMVFGNDYPTPDGTTLRDYLHVCDLAEGHLSALAYCRSHQGAEVFNLGRGQGVSVMEMVLAWNKANDMSLPYTMEPRRPGDVAESYANADKARELLGWEAVRSVEDMCRDTWNWQKNNPMGYRE